MALPALLDGRRPHWCFYGCRGCCYGCRGLPELNKRAVGRFFTVLFRPPRPHLPHPALQHGASTQGTVGGSWTGCCRRRDLSTDVPSTQSSERGSSRDFLPDTRFTGETGQCVCVCVCILTFMCKIEYREMSWMQMHSDSGTYCLNGSQRPTKSTIFQC